MKPDSMWQTRSDQVDQVLIYCSQEGDTESVMKVRASSWTQDLPARVCRKKNGERQRTYTPPKTQTYATPKLTTNQGLCFSCMSVFPPFYYAKVCSEETGNMV